MMWKTLIFLAVASVVWAGKLKNKRDVKYEFHIKHDYDYHKHHEKSSEEAEKTEDVKEEAQNEEVNNESEEANESDSNSESEESNGDDENEYKGYEFFYKVIDPHTHDTKGQHEKKHAGEITGVYWLLQPDGYKRTVDYHVDKHNGFKAKVDYTKSEEHKNEEEHDKAKSEYYVKKYHGKKYIPVREEQEEQEQDKQEESAENIPIYVI